MMPSISTNSANFSGVHLNAILVGLNARFQVGDAEHLSSDAEEQIVLPLHVFCSVRQ